MPNTLGFCPKIQKLSAANQNRARKTPILRQPINRAKNPFKLSAANQNRALRHPRRQPIRIEYYVTRELPARVEDPSRLLPSRYSLSY